MFEITYGLKQDQTRLVRGVALGLDLLDVAGGDLELSLKAFFVIEETMDFSFKRCVFLYK